MLKAVESKPTTDKWRDTVAGVFLLALGLLIVSVIIRVLFWLSYKRTDAFWGYNHRCNSGYGLRDQYACDILADHTFWHVMIFKMWGISIILILVIVATIVGGSVEPVPEPDAAPQDIAEAPPRFPEYGRPQRPQFTRPWQELFAFDPIGNRLQPVILLAPAIRARVAAPVSSANESSTPAEQAAATAEARERMFEVVKLTPIDSKDGTPSYHLEILTDYGIQVFDLSAERMRWLPGVGYSDVKPLARFPKATFRWFGSQVVIISPRQPAGVEPYVQDV